MAAKVRRYRDAWWVRTHHAGKRYDRRIGSTKADKRAAEEIARTINAKLALGEFDPQPSAQPDQPTFRDIADRWFQTEIQLPIERSLDGAVSPKTATLHRTHLDKRILPTLGDGKITELGVSEVQALYEACLAQMVSRGSGGSTPLSARTIEMTMGTLPSLPTTMRHLAHPELL